LTAGGCPAAGGPCTESEENDRMRIFSRSLIAAFFICLALGLPSAESASRFFLDLESGMVYSGYNDVRIPGDTGTEFSLSEDLDSKSKPFFRVRIGYRLSDRSAISLLAAPLEIEADGDLASDIHFEGEIFPAGDRIAAIYRFDSYRLTYSYDFYRSERVTLGAGVTAKIRDAEISLAGQDAESKKSNVGFVPLLNFRLHYGLNDRVGILLSGDALAAPQGRAEDVLTALTFSPSDRLQLRLGYRLLEGGADNDEVYNFALLHYVSIGAMLKQ
jgi:hypothetical protein